MNFRPSRYFTINLPSEHTVRMVCRGSVKEFSQNGLQALA